MGSLSESAAATVYPAAAQSGAAVAHRGAFLRRVFAGVGGAIQSIHGPAPGPERGGGGRIEIRDEPASDGRRPYFLD